MNLPNRALRCSVVAVALLVSWCVYHQFQLPRTSVAAPQEHHKLLSPNIVRPEQALRPQANPAANSRGTAVETRAEEFVRFDEWVQRYRSAATPADKALLEAEGIALAKARLTVMADLVQTYPERAFQQSAPYETRSVLPASVLENMEKPLNTRGDLAVLAVIGEADQPSQLPPVMRTIKAQGVEYQAFTYGAGNRFMTKSDIPIYGLAVPNDAASVPFVTSLGRPRQLMALSESPARWLGPAETAAESDLRAQNQEPDPICGVSNVEVTSKQTETVIELGGEIHSFCGKVDADLWLGARMAALGLDEPTPNLASLDVAESSFTEGRKKMLLMRPKWSDHAEGISTNDAVTHWQNFSNYMFEMSYGKLVLAPLGKGSDITPAMTLPGLVAEYDNTGLGKLYQTCQDVARDTFGYDLTEYDFLYVCTDGKPAASYCGLAYVGGVGFHLANRCFDAAVSSHEFGHNLGLNHAHFWDTALKSAIGDGQNVEYGDNNDPMGGGGSPNQYNSRYKNYLGWIKDSDIVDLNAAGSGTYRLYSFDGSVGIGVRGLKFRRNANQNYWLNFRQRKTSKKALMNGVQLLWSGNGNEGTYLLDVRLKGNADDNAIVIGRTFSDPSIDFHFTPIGKANTYPEAIDIVVNSGKFPTNQPPIGFVQASPEAAGQNQSVTFTVDASDPNGDTLAYFWEFGDGEYSTDNRPTATHSYADAGEYAVQCTVSDMKGGVAKQTVIVSIGSPNTFRISGHVVDASNRPLAGIRVSVDATHYAISDSDGSYTIVNLPAGSYNIDAIEPLAGALSFAHPYFNNPVEVGPSQSQLDFVGVPGSLIVKTPFITKKAAGWKYLDTGVDQGTAWISPDFNDRSWKTGTAILGYGQGGEGTVISFGASSSDKIPTYYFRKSFVVKDPLTFTNYLVEVLRDDGVLVYLNGKEIYRNNLPQGQVGYTTRALDSVEPDSYLFTSVPNSDLVVGTNWIAAEIHQSTPNSSDATFDLAVSGQSISNVAGFHIAYLSEPRDQARFVSGSTIDLRSTIHSVGTISKVAFLADGALVGEDTSAPYEQSWAGAPDGDHVLRAVATIGGVQVTSPPVRIRIAPQKEDPLKLDLLAVGSSWRYLSRSSAAPATWPQPSFNDSTWLVGDAPLGFGQPGIVTTINGGSSGSRYPTVYFRSTVVVEDPASLTTLTASLKRDDGAVVYINGVEVLRNNLAAGTVSYSTLADSASDNGSVFYSFSLPSSAIQLLAPGTNTIAVEVHQSSATSSDLVFDLGLSATADQIRSRGSWLTSPTSGATLSSASAISLSAEAVAGGSLGISKVEFFADSHKIGEDTTSPYNVLWNDAPAGTRLIYVVATDTAGETIQSMTVPVEIIAANPGRQLISSGQVWKYLDDGSDPASAWLQRTFDDRLWKAGATRLGYGVTDLATTISAGTNTLNRYITAYFRRAFVVANPADFSALLLKLTRNDGAAVYLNGKEILRDNLPGSRISFNTLALERVAGTPASATREFQLPAAGLVAGTNVIAVELHQQSQTSTDAVFDLSLVGVSTSASGSSIFITSPADQAYFNQPASIPLAAELTGGAPGDVVEYYADGQKIGQSDTPPYRLNWTGAELGTHSIVARSSQNGTVRLSPAIDVVVEIKPVPITPVFDKLIPMASQWRYWDSTAAVAAGWNAAGFDDSAWPRGNGRLGFGLDGEATTLSAGRMTYYFRRTFSVANPAAYNHLVVSLARDDGAVVYLNGKELYRSNMPDGLITSSTPARDVVNTPEETTFFDTIIPLSGSGLRSDENVLAVELHQQTASSSDAAFDLQLIGIGTSERRVAIISPAGAGTLPSDEDLAIQTAVQSGSSGVNVARVEVFDGATKLGESQSSPWIVTWVSPALGSHSLVARGWFSDGSSLDSSVLKVTIAAPIVTKQLVAADAKWSFFDQGQNLGTAWRDKTYSDASWATGAARLGYGEDGETTTVGFGPNSSSKYITTYFRKTFEVASDLVLTNLAIRYQRDDGVAVYLNGKELFRSNLAAGAGFNTPAQSQVNGADEQTWFTTNVISTNLVAGINVIAAEVHQGSASSSDLGFALELVASGYSKKPPTVRPRLDVTLNESGEIRLSWPSGTIGYSLYSSATLDQPLATWTLVGAAPVSVGDRSVVVLPASGEARFFRLINSP